MAGGGAGGVRVAYFCEGDTPSPPPLRRGLAQLVPLILASEDVPAVSAKIQGLDFAGKD
jgi:hypothetical protein